MRFHNKLLLLLTYGAICFASIANAAEPSSSATLAARQELLQKSQRILFLGDSITADGGYVINFEAWRIMRRDAEPQSIVNMGLSSETTSGLSEEGHAGGKFPRPDLFERLDRVLALAKPDLVFACYGMNDGIYEPLDEARFTKYRDGMTRLKTAVEKVGAILIMITPPFYDAQKHPNKQFYDGVLTKYAEWLNERGEKDDWHVIDLHTAMAQEVASRRKSQPNFTFAGDGVHPNKEGHWLITQQLIAWFGDSNAATATTPQEMLANNKAPDKLYALVNQRSNVLRDAYVAKAGHKRPGVAKGLPLDEADRQAAELTEQIKKLLMASK
jgi:lysophospholipase L1-like esterase